MESMPGRLLNAIADATIGTAIVILHLVLADRTRHRELRSAKHDSTLHRARA
jgi:hypothetical protein